MYINIRMPIMAHVHLDYRSKRTAHIQIATVLEQRLCKTSQACSVRLLENHRQHPAKAVGLQFFFILVTSPCISLPLPNTLLSPQF